MKKGFTLVEIMVVIAVISIIFGIAVMHVLRARANANEIGAEATLKTFATACETFAMSHNSTYPQNITDLTEATPPYFYYDLNNSTKQGYSFTVELGSASDNSYTITARALPRAGNWDYQISPGLTLKRTSPGGDTWEGF